MIGTANNIGALNQDPTMRDPVTGEPVAVPGGLPGALPATSAPSGSGAGANVSGAPLPQDPTQQSQAGGAESGAIGTADQAGAAPGGPPDLTPDRGTGEQKLMQTMTTDPASLADLQEGVLKRIEAARKDPVAVAQAKQMTDLQEQQGIPADASKEELKAMTEEGLKRAEADGNVTKKEASKLRKRFNKVYETIHRDEMGLFLLDFGLRAMMAGESMGDMAAIGAAGSGAMGALQGRRAEAEQKRVDDAKYAEEQGLEQYGKETDRYEAETGRFSAEELAKRGALGYTGKEAWLAARYKKQGYTEEQINDILMGAEGTLASAQELGMKLTSLIANAGILDKFPVGGEMVELKKMTPAQQSVWIQEQLQLQAEAANAFDRQRKEQDAFGRAATGAGVSNQ